jgi:hypothetical protein
MDYVLEHPEIPTIKIETPLMIIGLPRTGSTLLYNLLSCDENSRSPKQWEMGFNCAPLPPPERGNDSSHPAYAQAKRDEEEFKKYFPETLKAICQGHYLGFAGVEEESLILNHQLINLCYLNFAGDGYWEWLFNESNKEEAYTYLLRFLQVLSSGYAPKRHWLLKAPIHLLYFRTLIDIFPDAQFVMTHRDPSAVIPSFKKLNDNCASFLEKYPPQDGNKWARYFGRATARMLKERRGLSESKVFDVAYKDLLTDPIQVVKDIYNFHGILFSSQFEEKMKCWLQENPQVGISLST